MIRIRERRSGLLQKQPILVFSSLRGGARKDTRRGEPYPGPAAFPHSPITQASSGPPSPPKSETGRAGTMVEMACL